jgi:hypothetical protein
MAAETGQRPQWFLNSSFPVLLPYYDALTLSEASFKAFWLTELRNRNHHNSSQDACGYPSENSDTETLSSWSSDDWESALAEAVDPSVPAHYDTANTQPFMRGLLDKAESKGECPMVQNEMLTTNGDLAYRSTTSSLVDLFNDADDSIPSQRLVELLDAAWQKDPLNTLKLLFNARSIHLGKSSRNIFYRAAGWLAQHHPATLVHNLQWLVRPVIEKKKNEGKKKNVFDFISLSDTGEGKDDYSMDDQRNGLAHGYWKDLLNILVLSAKGDLDPLCDPKDSLNTKRIRSYRHGGPKAMMKHSLPPQLLSKTIKRCSRHDAVVDKFHNDAVHRVIHLTISRLFARQLVADLEALQCNGSSTNGISLCAKWAPSSKLFHDQYTFIVSSIAEILHPREEFTDIEFPDADAGRELYLRHAREAYRKDISALRKYLDVVERKLSANNLADIKYERLPSLAMKNYTTLFATKDADRFEQYLARVSEGKSQISGATLMPSWIVRDVFKGMKGNTTRPLQWRKPVVLSKKHLKAKRIGEMQSKALDCQWRALVRRLQDSGTLSSSIAVCDVSSSMNGPTFPDGTCPLYSAIGLSLLVAEVTAAPFNGAFITFSRTPTVQSLDLSTSLREKCHSIKTSDWGMNTDFTAVFEDLILPIARANCVKPEDMVKRVFVFSDMQFDASQTASGARWQTSYGRIKKAYSDAGYDVPELVFWNLAGHGQGGAVPKPVTAQSEGTVLISGYSQAMLKIFMDNGGFGELDRLDDMMVSETEGDDGQIIVSKAKRQKMDPMRFVRKAVDHKAYRMLTVID